MIASGRLRLILFTTLRTPEFANSLCYVIVPPKISFLLALHVYERNFALHYSERLESIGVVRTDRSILMIRVEVNSKSELLRIESKIPCCYPTSSEGRGHGGRPWSPRSRTTLQGLDQRSYRDRESPKSERCQESVAEHAD